MYSPPPLDGFSPPPMSDFSPPPLSDLSPLRDFPPPINGFSGGDETEDDGDFNFALGDNQYDLTGLSDKINRLELEKMKSLPPREILELKRESSSLFTDNIPLEPASDLQSDIDIETNGEHLVKQAKNSCPLTSHDLETESLEEHNVNIGDQETICDRGQDDDKNDSESSVIETPREEILQSAAMESAHNEGCKTVENEEDVPVVEDAEDEEEVIQQDNEVVNSKTEADWESGAFENVAEDDDACWGEFPEEDAANGSESWSNFPPVPTDEWSLPAETNMDDKEDLQFDDSEDDDFGDFGEASEQVQNINKEEIESSLFLELKELIEKSNSMLESVYNLPHGEVEAGDEVVRTCLQEAVMREGEIFQKIEIPAAAPALEHEWRNSATYNTLLLTLGIDSSSNLEGEEWRSSAGRLAPRSAASLMTPGLLTPQAVTERPDQPEQKGSEAETITPAQFDWNKSGLTNPLSENGRNLSLLDIEFFTNTSLESSLSLLKTNNDTCQFGAKSSTDTIAESKMVIEDNREVVEDNRKVVEDNMKVVEDNNNDQDGNKLYQDHIRREAQNILDGLPLLNFMSSNVLMFPTKSINKVKHKQPE